MKQEMISYLSTIKDEILSLSKYLYDNPEKSYEEYNACSYITSLLRKYNFQVMDNYLQIPTAFYGEYGHGHPKICFICEYDALEGYHVSGHNILSAMSVGASLSLTKTVDKIGGSLIVLGCPGEYISGSIMTMSKQGAFEDIDAAIMLHPDIVTAESGTSNAVIPLKIKYKNNENPNYTAMDAFLFTYNGISHLTRGFSKDWGIDGVTLKGGSTFCNTPSQIESKLYIRAPKFIIAEELQKKIRELVITASSLMDIYCSVSIFNEPYMELIPNKTLSRIFSHNLKEIGIIDIQNPRNATAGISLGSASHLIPCIHPYISVVENPSVQFPSREFAAATQSYFAQNKILQGAQAIACTAIDLIEKPNLLKEIKLESCIP